MKFYVDAYADTNVCFTYSYGELGYVIIHQTIYDLFTPQSFPPLSTLPITPTEFIQLILVPEAAVSLIMEDLSLTREQAITTLRESAEYGVAMFPYDQDDVGGDVGENIVKERARARRKQLKEEGAWDEVCSLRYVLAGERNCHR